MSGQPAMLYQEAAAHRPSRARYHYIAHSMVYMYICKVAR